MPHFAFRGKDGSVCPAVATSRKTSTRETSRVANWRQFYRTKRGRDSRPGKKTHGLYITNLVPTANEGRIVLRSVLFLLWLNAGLSMAGVPRPPGTAHLLLPLHHLRTLAPGLISTGGRSSCRSGSPDLDALSAHPKSNRIFRKS